MPEYVSAHLNLAMLLGSVFGDHVGATMAYTAALTLASTDRNAQIGLCDKYLQLGWLDEAGTYCEEVNWLFPDDPLSYVNQGLVTKAQGNYLQASEDFTQALHLNPRYIKAYLYLWDALEESAVPNLETAYQTKLQSISTWPYVHRFIATQLRKIGRTTQADLHEKQVR